MKKVFGYIFCHGKRSIEQRIALKLNMKFLLLSIQFKALQRKRAFTSTIKNKHIFA
jgi:hypothetical protein